MSTDLKLRKAQLSKMIQSGGFLHKILWSLRKRDLAIPLVRDNLPNLVSNLASNATSNVSDKLGKK